jgi:hypothetical protein
MGYGDTDEDEEDEIRCAAESQWVLGVDVLIQMANWVAVSGHEPTFSASDGRAD